MGTLKEEQMASVSFMVVYSMGKVLHQSAAESERKLEVMLPNIVNGE